MEPVCRVLAQQTDVCGMRAVADGQRTTRALRVRQVVMGYASAELNVA